MAFKGSRTSFKRLQPRMQTKEARRSGVKGLRSIERETCPFDKGIDKDTDAHWVSPKLVAEVSFTGWTGDERLRHPSFLGLRSDKSPKKVVKEA